MELDGDIEERIRDLRSHFAEISALVFEWLERRFPRANTAAVWVNGFLKSGLNDPHLIRNSVPDHFTLFSN